MGELWVYLICLPQLPFEAFALSRDQGRERKADQSKDGGDNNKPTTPAKFASEGITGDQQAPRYEPKFTSFSGGHDKKLHVHHFVIEDKEKGVQHTAHGEQKVGQQTERNTDHPEHKAEHTEHKPRASFLAGLKSILDAATNPKEAEAKQAEFSIAYMLRKAQEMMGLAPAKHEGDAKSPNARSNGEAGRGVHITESSQPPRLKDAVKTRAHESVDKLRPLTPQEASTYADSVKHVLNDWNLARIMNGGRPDVEELGHILQPLGKSQREQVDKAFQGMNDGQSIEKAGSAVLSGDNAAISRLHSIMRSGDNEVDNAALLEHSFATVHGSSALARTVDMIATPLGALPGPWQGISDAFAALHQSNDQSSRATEESTILRTLLKLDHHELSADSPIGKMVRDQIKHPESFSPATLEAMKMLLEERARPLKDDRDQAGKLAELGLSSHRLDIFQDAMRVCPELRKTYGDPAKEARLRQAFPDDLDFNIARDFAQHGQLGMATRMEGGAHFINPNKATIEEAIQHATPDEIALFRLGERLWNKEPIRSYTENELAAKHYYERINLAMKRASTFDEQQINRWEQALRGEQPKIQDTLKTFEENPLEKIFHNSAKSASTIEALAGMTPAEQAHFRSDKNFQQQIRDSVVHNLKPGAEQDMATRVLNSIAHGKQPEFDAIDLIMLNHLKGVQTVHSVELFERAVKEHPDRLRSGATPEDRQVKEIIENSVIALAHGVGIADNENNDIGRGYAKQFLETGHLSTRISWSIPGNELQLSDILNANQEERNILMHDSPNPRDNQLRDHVLGDGEKREFIRHLLDKSAKTGHPTSFDELSPSERVRAFVVGCGESQESLSKYLQGLSRAQIAQMNSEYMREYPGHILSKDVTAKLPLEGQSQFTMLVSNVDIAPGEAANRAQLTQDMNSSPVDHWTDRLWSLKKYEAQEHIDQMNDAIAKYGSNLNEKQKDELKERLRAYYKAEADFANSKAGAAHALVDASVSLATLSASLMGAEVTIPFLLASGAGGAVYSVGIHSIVEGKRFKMDSAHLGAAGGDGFAAAFSGLAGAETFGFTGFFRVSESAANQVAQRVLQKGAYGALRPDAEKIIARELQNITEVTASTSPRAAMEKLARDVTEGGASNPKLAEALAEQLQQRVKQSSAHRLEAEKMLINAGGNTANSIATEAIHAASGTLSTEDLMQSLQQSTVTGAVMYKLTAVSHSVAKALTADEARTIFICRDADNRLYAGRGATVLRPDGARFTVTGSPYELQPTDKLVFATDKLIGPVSVKVEFPKMAGAGGDWPIINPRKSPDVVQSLHRNACAAACVEMITDGRYTQERMIEELRGHFLPEMLSEHPTADIDMCRDELNKVYGGGWKSGAPATEEEAMLLIRAGKFVAEFKHKLPDGKSAAKGHEVVVDGMNDDNLVMIRDPADGERYEMKLDDFLDSWRGRRFLRYFGGASK